MSITASTVVVMLNNGTQTVVIAKDPTNKPQWKFPGGQIEKSEPIQQPALRELGTEPFWTRF
jgi:ADP-ribose pyrophosphatase YjhB (NUDIX family)